MDLLIVLADVLGGWLAPDDYDRPPMSPLADMSPDPDELDVHLHLSLLDQWQRQVAASYATPLDGAGRVLKVQAGGGHE